MTVAAAVPARDELVPTASAGNAGKIDCELPPLMPPSRPVPAPFIQSMDLRIEFKTSESYGESHPSLKDFVPQTRYGDLLNRDGTTNACGEALLRARACTRWALALDLRGGGGGGGGGGGDTPRDVADAGTHTASRQKTSIATASVRRTNEKAGGARGRAS